MSPRTSGNPIGFRVNKILFAAVALVLLGQMLAVSGQSLSDSAARMVTQRDVAPGCLLYQITDTEQVLAISVLRVDLSNPYIRVESALSQDFGAERKTVLELCRLHDRPHFRVAAGINADFFAGNRPVGTVVRDRELLKKGRGWSALGFTLDKVPTIRVFSDAPASNLDRFQDVIGGGPRILRAGQVSVEREKEGQREGFDSESHPRTAVGFTQDRRYLVLAVVDGRQPGHSRGVSLYELAEILLEFGCTEALNLDGGGSSTMVIRNRVVNSPSDPFGARPVASALLIICTSPLG
jgi:hypothetical protein